jgi:glycosyltransferase involved in cell wall biosynthesis
MERIPVLYIRQAAGGGGGADTMIANAVSLLNKTPFAIILAYLRKHTESIEAVYKTLTERNIAYLDLPGGSFFDLRQFMEIAAIIKTHQVRIVHCHDPKSDLYGYVLRLLFPKIKFVSTLHGWIAKRTRSKYYVVLDKFIVRNFDAVIAVSDQILETAAKHGIQNLHVVKNSIDVNKWSPRGVRPTSFNLAKIGFVGRLSEEKGPLDFIRVAKTVLDRHAHAEFHVAGTGPEESAMKALVRQSGIESKVHFSGQLDIKQLWGFYQELDILLLTSYTEGVPLTILEAGAMGIPVVATNVGGVGEVVTHEKNGLLAPAGDIASLANNVLRILNDKNLGREMGLAGRSIVEKDFSIEANVRKVQTIYENIIDVAKADKVTQ